MKNLSLQQPLVRGVQLQSASLPYFARFTFAKDPFSVIATHTLGHGNTKPFAGNRRRVSNES